MAHVKIAQPPVVSLDRGSGRGPPATPEVGGATGRLQLPGNAHQTEKTTSYPSLLNTLRPVLSSIFFDTTALIFALARALAPWIDHWQATFLVPVYRRCGPVARLLALGRTSARIPGSPLAQCLLKLSSLIS